MAPPMDLGLLQSRTKKDPDGYREEFLLQYNHFQTKLQIFLLNPSKDFKPFTQLVNYISHVSHCYPDVTAEFPNQLVELLEKNAALLEPDLRKSLVKSLILLRTKNAISPLSLFALFFKLFSVHDKELRALLYSHIIGDIQKISKSNRDTQVSRSLQNFMYAKVNDTSEIVASKALTIMIELHKKGIWADDKTVNVIASGCFSKHSKIVVDALKFFLTTRTDDSEARMEEEKEKATKEAKKIKRKLKVSKTSKRAKRNLQKELSDTKKVKSQQKDTEPNWPAIELIYDPQGFADKLFGLLKRTGERLEVRLMIMNLISRLIYTHKLLLLNFYPFLQKFLTAQQKHVTYILAVLAQATHELVPPEALDAVVRTIADNFVNDRSRVEAITAGLNTIREMCSRNPHILRQELLRDLAQFKTHKEKAIMSAARGIITIYRASNPILLARRDRLRGNKQATNPQQYGGVKVHSGVEGIELLEQLEQMDASGNYADDSGDEEELEEVEGEESGEEDGDEDGEEDEEEDLEGEADDEEVDEEVGEEVDEEEEEEEEEEGEEDGGERGEDEDGEEASSDEENEGVIVGEANINELVPKDVSARLDATRILTDQDFMRLNKLRELSSGGALKISRDTRQTIDEEDSEESSSEENNDGVVNPEDIAYFKKQKLTSEQKRALAMEGRKDRGKFGHKERERIYTNDEKTRNKNYMMVLGKAKRSKKSLSMREKQMQRGKSINKHKRRRFL